MDLSIIAELLLALVLFTGLAWFMARGIEDIVAVDAEAQHTAPGEDEP